jgi:16S rRNA processing protein RimM
LYVHFYKRFIPKVGKEVYLEDKESLRGPFVIRSLKKYKEGYLMSIENCYNRDTAESFKGCSIGMKVEKLPEDVFFCDDILGCAVYSCDGKIIGKIVDVYKLPAGDVYCIKRNGDETLIPAVKAYIKKVDTEKKEIWLSMKIEELE